MPNSCSRCFLKYGHWSSSSWRLKYEHGGRQSLWDWSYIVAINCKTANGVFMESWSCLGAQLCRAPRKHTGKCKYSSMQLSGGGGGVNFQPFCFGHIIPEANPLGRLQTRSERFGEEKILLPLTLIEISYTKFLTAKTSIWLFPNNSLSSLAHCWIIIKTRRFGSRLCLRLQVRGMKLLNLSVRSSFISCTQRLRVAHCVQHVKFCIGNVTTENTHNRNHHSWRCNR
jgi:hypothetical protein